MSHQNEPGPAPTGPGTTAIAPPPQGKPTSRRYRALSTERMPRGFLYSERAELRMVAATIRAEAGGRNWLPIGDTWLTVRTLLADHRDGRVRGSASNAAMAARIQRSDKTWATHSAALSRAGVLVRDDSGWAIPHWAELEGRRGNRHQGDLAITARLIYAVHRWDLALVAPGTGFGANAVVELLRLLGYPKSDGWIAPSVRAVARMLQADHSTVHEAICVAVMAGLVRVADDGGVHLMQLQDHAQEARVAEISEEEVAQGVAEISEPTAGVAEISEEEVAQGVAEISEPTAGVAEISEGVAEISEVRQGGPRVKSQVNASQALSSKALNEVVNEVKIEDGASNESLLVPVISSFSDDFHPLQPISSLNSDFDLEIHSADPTSPTSPVAPTNNTGNTSNTGNTPVEPPWTVDEALLAALADACGLKQPLRPATQRSWERAASELAEIGVRPEEVHRRAAIHRRMNHWETLTPARLVRHWAELTPQPKPKNERDARMGHFEKSWAGKAATIQELRARKAAKANAPAIPEWVPGATPIASRVLPVSEESPC